MTNAELTERISLLEDEIKRIIRRQETAQTSLDLIYKDRNLLEDIVEGIREIRRAIQTTDVTVKNVIADVKDEMSDQVKEVGVAVETVDKTLQKKTIIERLSHKPKGFFSFLFKRR
jgi:methyl-accepting chemotaxis protein